MASTQRFSQFVAGSPEQYLHGSFPLPYSYAPKENLRVVSENNGAGKVQLSQFCAPAPCASPTVLTRPVLLQVSDDPSLAKSRSAMLQSIGFKVMLASGAEALKTTVEDTLAALLICQTIRWELAESILHRLRKREMNPQAIRVISRTQAAPEGYDMIMQSPVPPDFFVHEMAKVYTDIQHRYL